MHSVFVCLFSFLCLIRFISTGGSRPRCVSILPQTWGTFRLLPIGHSLNTVIFFSVFVSNVSHFSWFCFPLFFPLHIFLRLSYLVHIRCIVWGVDVYVVSLSYPVQPHGIEYDAVRCNVVLRPQSLYVYRMKIHHRHGMCWMSATSTETA